MNKYNSTKGTINNENAIIPNNIFDFKNQSRSQIFEKWYDILDVSDKMRKLIIGCGDSKSYKDEIYNYDFFICYPEKIDGMPYEGTYNYLIKKFK